MVVRPRVTPVLLFSRIVPLLKAQGWQITRGRGLEEGDRIYKPGRRAAGKDAKNGEDFFLLYSEYDVNPALIDDIFENGTLSPEQIWCSHELAETAESASSLAVTEDTIIAEINALPMDLDNAEKILRAMLTQHSSNELRKACTKLRLDALRRDSVHNNKQDYIHLLWDYYKAKRDAGKKRPAKRRETRKVSSDSKYKALVDQYKAAEARIASTEAKLQQLLQTSGAADSNSQEGDRRMAKRQKRTETRVQQHAADRSSSEPKETTIEGSATQRSSKDGLSLLQDVKLQLLELITALNRQWRALKPHCNASKEKSEAMGALVGEVLQSQEDLNDEIADVVEWQKISALSTPLAEAGRLQGLRFQSESDEVLGLLRDVKLYLQQFVVIVRHHRRLLFSGGYAEDSQSHSSGGTNARSENPSCKEIASTIALLQNDLRGVMDEMTLRVTPTGQQDLTDDGEKTDTDIEE